MKLPGDVFTKISRDGRRAWCPKCDADGQRIQGTISINGDYAYCHKCNDDWQFGKEFEPKVSQEYALSSTFEVEPTEAVEKSSYDACRSNYLKNSDKIIKKLKLPWNDISKAEMFGIGVRRDKEKKLQLVFRITQDHIKYHKGKQFGSAKCKVFPSPNLLGPCKKLLLCEGEKDVITANCHGASAITFTSGAGALPDDVTLLDKYNNIVICYDNDDKGREGALKTARALYKKGRNIAIVQWNGQPEKYDLTDYLKYNSIDDLWNFAQEFGASPVDLGGMPMFSPGEFTTKFNEMPEPIIDDLFFKKDIMGIAGGSNVGKSVISLQLSTCLALGVPFLNFRVPKARKVMHVQFELKDESFSNLLQRTAMPILEKYPIEAPRFEKNCSILSSGQMDVFTDKWEQIDKNLMHHPCDVLVVDNLYTSTHKNVSRNSEIQELLRTIVNLKNTHNVAIIIVSHHKKIGEMQPLDMSQMLGGSAYTNHLDAVVQMASSNRMQGLKVMKITKVRSQNDLHGVPVGIKLINDEVLYFEYLKPLPKNEMFWYTDPKESREEEVLQTVVTDGDNFSSDAFATALEKVTGLASNKAVYNWLEKMISIGLIGKIGHGQYRKMRTELDNFSV